MVGRRAIFARVTICLISSWIFISCSKTIDITNDEILGGQYHKGMILVAKEEILIRHNGKLWDHQSEIDSYKRGYRKDEFKGIIKKGTRLKIEKNELFSHVENGNYIYPIAMVLDGEWKGEIVNLIYTSISSKSPHNVSHHIRILDVDKKVFDVIHE